MTAASKARVSGVAVGTIAAEHLGMTGPASYCIGSINLDFQVRSDRWPDEGETLETANFLRAPGGKGANRAYLARLLGQPSVLVGCVGDDDFGREALASLRQVGVDVAPVRISHGKPTGVSMIVVRPDGTKTILLASNANAHCEPSDRNRIESLLNQAPRGSVVSVDLEVPPEIVEAALRSARGRELCVVLDPSPADRMRDDYYKYVDWLTPNHTEAAKLTGKKITDADSARKAAEMLVAAGARGACVKLPNGGVVAIYGDEHYLINAPEVDVVDKTGAGDAFAGALAVAWLEDQALGRALRFAVHAASLATTAYGSQAAYPERASLEEHIRGDKE